MPLFPEWVDIASRLLATILACAALGLDRGESGKPAGMRTVILVGLVGALSMIAANVLLPTDGKTEASFARLDLMRLPLGVLTGMGFIGAGAIVRHGNSVEGLTTASTLWLATMIGILFGGGLFALGLAASLVGVAALVALKWLEHRLGSRRRGTLRVVGDAMANLGSLRLDGASLQLQRFYRRGNQTRAEYRVVWDSRSSGIELEDPVELLRKIDGVQSVELEL